MREAERIANEEARAAAVISAAELRQSEREEAAALLAEERQYQGKLRFEAGERVAIAEARKIIFKHRLPVVEAYPGQGFFDVLNASTQPIFGVNLFYGNYSEGGSEGLQGSWSVREGTTPTCPVILPNEKFIFEGVWAPAPPPKNRIQIVGYEAYWLDTAGAVWDTDNASSTAQQRSAPENPPFRYWLQAHDDEGNVFMRDSPEFPGNW